MKTPESVAIVAMGLSNRDYLFSVSCVRDRHKIADETWAVNVMGGVIQCDRIFMMDPVEKLYDAGYKWLLSDGPPIYTSKTNERFGRLIEYPLKDIVDKFGINYLNNTVAYCIAYAIHIGVKKLVIFGVDFNYTDRSWSETGRGCVEFWLGIAVCNGVEIEIAEHSTLLGTNEPKLYGYGDIKYEDM